MNDKDTKEIIEFTIQINNFTNEAIVLINKVMDVLPDVACEVPATLDGKLALAYAQLKQAKQLLQKITGNKL